MIANLYIEDTVELAASRMERFSARLPSALSNAFHPKDWLPLARRSALDTLMVLARPEQQPYVQEFVRTILVEDKGLGMDWKMRAPSGAQELNVQAAADLAAAGQLFLEANSAMTAQLVDTIARWVATEKNKTAKGDRDDGVIVARLLRILRQADVQSPVPGTVGGGVVLHSKAEGLIRHLQDFANRAPGIFRDHEVNEWMDAVLVAWEELILSLLPARIMEELYEAW